MSTYVAPTFHPRTGKIEQARWIDDYFSSHHYGVLFPDGELFDPWDVNCEQVLPKAMAEITKLKTTIKELHNELHELRRTPLEDFSNV